MVRMGAIVIRRENRAEEAAGLVPCGAQELSFGAFDLPIPENGNLCSVLQPEAGYIDCARGGMCASAGILAPIDIPAGIGPEMLYASDVLVEIFHRQYVETLLVPIETCGERAGGFEAGAVRNTGLHDLGARFDAATVFDGTVL
jgi:hypothetical protein